MEVILSQRCKSLTGTIGSGFGYYIRSTKTGRFFSQRSRHSVPKAGHLRFIFACAELAKNGFMLSDIRVSRSELIEAVEEAGWCLSRFMENLRPTLNAADVLSFKERSGL